MQDRVMRIFAVKLMKQDQNTVPFHRQRDKDMMRTRKEGYRKKEKSENREEWHWWVETEEAHSPPSLLYDPTVGEPVLQYLYRASNMATLPQLNIPTKRSEHIRTRRLCVCACVHERERHCVSVCVQHLHKQYCSTQQSFAVPKTIILVVLIYAGFGSDLDQKRVRSLFSSPAVRVQPCVLIIIFIATVAHHLHHYRSHDSNHHHHHHQGHHNRHPHLLPNNHQQHLSSSFPHNLKHAFCQVQTPM